MLTVLTNVHRVCLSVRMSCSFNRWRCMQCVLRAQSHSVRPLPNTFGLYQCSDKDSTSSNILLVNVSLMCLVDVICTLIIIQSTFTMCSCLSVLCVTVLVSLCTCRAVYCCCYYYYYYSMYVSVCSVLCMVHMNVLVPYMHMH